MKWLVVVIFAVGCGPSAECTGRDVACDDSCVDVRVDRNNCGTCGHTCETGDVCSLATCAAHCVDGTTECGGKCIDVQSDHANCGMCGHQCPSGVACAAGTCASECGALTRCGDRCVDTQSSDYDCGACGTACKVGELCEAGACTTSAIKHVVLIVEENHTFDNYFGKYCTAAAGSNPTCTTGPACCEAAPATEPSGSAPIALTDASNEIYDRDHEQVCELAQIHGGLMDRYVVGSGVTIDPISGIYTYDCSDPHNFAVADGSVVSTYWNYAGAGALADRYFQPIVGSTSANDMYLAVAHWQFTDNTIRPLTIGSGCLGPGGSALTYSHVATVADLLVNNGFTFKMYADGYADAVAAAPLCPSTTGRFPADCEPSERTTMYSTCNYDPADLGFEYYTQFADKAPYIVDSDAFAADVTAGRLPTLAYVKARTYRNEHPKWSTISRGIGFVQGIVDAVKGSAYASDTLILLVWDEGGGFFDHVSPPAPPATKYDADENGKAVPYGTRVPLLVIGPFAKVGAVSHVTLEHSSLVRFLEHNFLGARHAGALGNRDAAVSNIGSLLDSATTGIAIP